MNNLLICFGEIHRVKDFFNNCMKNDDTFSLNEYSLIKEDKNNLCFDIDQPVIIQGLGGFVRFKYPYKLPHSLVKNISKKYPSLLFQIFYSDEKKDDAGIMFIVDEEEKTISYETLNNNTRKSSSQSIFSLTQSQTKNDINNIINSLKKL